MNQKRLVLAEIYSNKWVAKLSDAQVLVIYTRLQNKGIITL